MRRARMRFAHLDQGWRQASEYMELRACACIGKEVQMAQEDHQCKQDQAKAHLLHQVEHELVTLVRRVVRSKVVEPVALHQVGLAQLQQHVLYLQRRWMSMIAKCV